MAANEANGPDAGVRREIKRVVVTGVLKTEPEQCLHACLAALSHTIVFAGLTPEAMQTA